jgi:thioredoxin reductase (NADPH)
MYDLIIIGAGPAGLTASIYASRYRIGHLLIGSQLGGAMSLASSVENYPGFKKITGGELTKKMVEQVKGLGGEIINGNVIQIHHARAFKICTESGREYEARALILATGTQRRKLNIPGETEYLGRGVSYCATCDAAFFKDKTVVVIGGSNSAAQAALHLAGFAKKVYLVYRRKPLRAEPIWVERIKKNNSIEVVYNVNVTKILGDGMKVTKIEWDKDKKGLAVEGIFVEIGGVPGADLVKPLGVELDEKGYIKVGSDMSTNIAGVFAAGDVANAAGELQQIVTAASEGAIAATSVYKYLKT